MTTEEARAIWYPLVRGGEGVLDAQLRLALQGRTLTASEQEAADVLWQAFVAGLKAMSAVGRAAADKLGEASAAVATAVEDDAPSV